MSLPIWSKYGKIYSLNPQIHSQRIDFDCLYITEREVGAFAKIFENFGYFAKNLQQSTQLIDIDKIISKLKLQRTNFHSRIFNTSQQNNHQIHHISFHDLILVIWNICTIDILSLGNFLSSFIY